VNTLPEPPADPVPPPRKAYTYVVVDGTSRAAIASFLLGILGLLFLVLATGVCYACRPGYLTIGFTAALGLIVGILSLKEIHSSRGRLVGSTLAVSGILLSAGCGFLGVLTDYVVHSPLAILHEKPGCGFNLTATQIAMLGGMLDLYNRDIGHYPTEAEDGLRALLIKPDFPDPATSAKWRGPYIVKDLLTDRWGHGMRYLSAEPGTPDADWFPYKLWSIGPDGIDGTDDDVRNWSEAPPDQSPPPRSGAAGKSTS
jgi:general secretion pathway protein G